MTRSMKAIPAFLVLLPSLAVAEPRFVYESVNQFDLPPKGEPASVQIVDKRPLRRNVVMGRWMIVGDSASTEESLIALARDKAASLGADFVWITHRQTSTSRGFGAGSFGSSSARNVARISATLGVFAKATTGVQYMGVYISGFAPGSLASAAGAEIGDEVLEIDGLPLSSPRMPHQILDNKPGQVVKLLVKRGTRRCCFP